MILQCPHRFLRLLIRIRNDGTHRDDVLIDLHMRLINLCGSVPTLNVSLKHLKFFSLQCQMDLSTMCPRMGLLFPRPASPHQAASDGVRGGGAWCIERARGLNLYRTVHSAAGAEPEEKVESQKVSVHHTRTTYQMEEAVEVFLIWNVGIRDIARPRPTRYSLTSDGRPKHIASSVPNNATALQSLVSGKTGEVSAVHFSELPAFQDPGRAVNILYSAVGMHGPDSLFSVCLRTISLSHNSMSDAENRKPPMATASQQRRTFKRNVDPFQSDARKVGQRLLVLNFFPKFIEISMKLARCLIALASAESMNGDLRCLSCLRRCLTSNESLPHRVEKLSKAARHIISYNVASVSPADRNPKSRTTSLCGLILTQFKLVGGLGLSLRIFCRPSRSDDQRCNAVNSPMSIITAKDMPQHPSDNPIRSFWARWILTKLIERLCDGLSSFKDVTNFCTHDPLVDLRIAIILRLPSLASNCSTLDSCKTKFDRLIVHASKNDISLRGNGGMTGAILVTGGSFPGWFRASGSNLVSFPGLIKNGSTGRPQDRHLNGQPHHEGVIQTHSDSVDLKLEVCGVLKLRTLSLGFL
ncbi:uncharacterized protein MYCFIDRAFT_173823 [Pseudocercospora fijiensis CIRAD86]|uniref:Uncharacterized protein n=1 Tax=Pseudocercospora fijiensis (strain CIRAD86) TaxID=383855 RepID=M3B6E0_PSEFD|nr:uncharacterized protein MYCFIDRAFT_173823 [Pseudocercospora fijiensis CIRAD86]EME84932.1 hypothetical protein MYCFIDRAFT_173823 [Pseudocercospora fijiensis CIRAD86]